MRFKSNKGFGIVIENCWTNYTKSTGSWPSERGEDWTSLHYEATTFYCKKFAILLHLSVLVARRDTSQNNLLQLQASRNIHLWRNFLLEWRDACCSTHCDNFCLLFLVWFSERNGFHLYNVQPSKLWPPIVSLAERCTETKLPANTRNVRAEQHWFKPLRLRF